MRRIEQAIDVKQGLAISLRKKKDIFSRSIRWDNTRPKTNFLEASVRENIEELARECFTKKKHTVWTNIAIYCDFLLSKRTENIDCGGICLEIEYQYKPVRNVIESNELGGVWYNSAIDNACARISVARAGHVTRCVTYTQCPPISRGRSILHEIWRERRKREKKRARENGDSRWQQERKTECVRSFVIAAKGKSHTRRARRCRDEHPFHAHNSFVLP